MARRKAHCFCCPPNKSGLLQPVEGHHVIPVEYDGPEDGKLVDICASCHDLIHSEAEYYFTHGEFTSTLTEKQELLAKYIVEAKLRFKASGKNKADEARNMIAIPCDNDELLIFHMMKKKRGFKSLPRYIKYLVAEDYKKNR